MVQGTQLREIDIFNGLTHEQLEMVATRCQEIEFAQEDIVLHESDHSSEMYIIDQGEVEITVKTRNSVSSAGGGAAIIRLGAGQIFGEMALVDQGLRSATVRCCVTPTRLFTIRYEDFMLLCDEDSNLGFVVMRNIAADVCFKLRSHNLAWK